ncbi:site-specific integrase [Motiliproteus sp. MSK22-1]|uniref:site-specific integrase n=1 Tax=Motiliproteus sp. MSK22-1 TaxID=1897630 RepID=UPI000977E63E|nr:site-specific integrase [Motiliproteus sp. MSK22-1]OMH38824.1 hypothetical protein BGP75_00130 [Motiliproteus sp. MSK22-1]
MNIEDQIRFDSLYQRCLNELTLQGKSLKTINMYSRCLRQVGDFFDCCPDNLTAEQLKIYFLDLVDRRSWNMVKVARNAIQFFYKHVLERPWVWIHIVKPPKVQSLQDVLSQEEVCNTINHYRLRRTRDYGFLHGNAKRTLKRLQFILKMKIAEQDYLQHKKTQRLCPCCALPMLVIPFIRP